MTKQNLIKALSSTLLITQSVQAGLINVDFGAGGGGQTAMEVGFAATGQTTNDYWNFYAGDNSKVNGSLVNLTNAAGVTTAVGLTVSNGAGVWANGTTDPMFNWYIYPLNFPGILTVTVTNLPAGSYNFYLYSFDSTFNLNVGGVNYGTQTNYDYPIVSPPPWVEGKHYVLFSNVVVGASQPASVVTVSPGSLNPAVICGLQIESVSTACKPYQATATATVVHGFVVGAGITDGGCGYTNTPLVVIQGGGGAGATATAVVSSGEVVGITITDAGVGYTNVPNVYIYSPFGLQIGLINVDFGAGGGGQTAMEIGFAATGQTTNDYWNFYAGANSKVNGSLVNLANAAGVTTAVGLTVSNAAGVSTNGTTDPMFNSYIYPLSSGNLTVTVTNLPAGSYNFYLYSFDSTFNLNVGGVNHGTQTNYDYPIVSPPPWVEGRHYVLFTNLVVGASQPASVVTVSPGSLNPAVICGLQIELVPPACKPYQATATATVVNGFVVGASITDGGCSYTNTPLVVIQGGGGTGATATAVVSNGMVVGITITDAGVGYTDFPNIYIYSPFGLQIGQIGLIKAIKPSFSNLLPGAGYQLQVSSDLINWTNQGSIFTPTNPVMDYPQYFDVNNWNQLFFRLNVAP
jgi:hypothetical protein